MRINTVKAARKAAGTCGSCGKPIEVGEAYKWIKPRYGSRRVRHTGCSDWRPSELTSSEKLGRLYSAREAIEDALSSFDGEDCSDLREALETAASEASEVAEEYNEAAENCAAVRDQCEEYSQAAESFSSECETAADMEDFDEDSVRDEIESEMRGEDPADFPEVPELIPESINVFQKQFEQYMAPYRGTVSKKVRVTGYSMLDRGKYVWKTDVDWKYGLGPCSEIRRNEARRDVNALIRAIAATPKSNRRKQWRRFTEHLSSLAGWKKLGKTLKAYWQSGRVEEVYEAALAAEESITADGESEWTDEQQAEIEHQLDAKREEWADECRDAAQTAIDALEL